MSETLAGVRFEADRSDADDFPTNSFPVRSFKRLANSGNTASGAWMVEIRDQASEALRRFQPEIAESDGRRRLLSAHLLRTSAADVEVTDGCILDGFFLMQHCCVDDPEEVCTVNLSGQKLVDVKADDLEFFRSLAVVNASENTLLFSAFSSLVSLESLDLSMNGIRNIQFSADAYRALKILNLSYNNLSVEDVGQLAWLDNVTDLNLSGNQLSSLPDSLLSKVFRPATAIRSEPLASDPAKRLYRFPFERLSSLNLDDNFLRESRVFLLLAHLRNLRHLSLKNNQIKSIPQIKFTGGKLLIYEIPTRSTTTNKSKKSSRKSARKSKTNESKQKLTNSPQNVHLNLNSPQLGLEISSQRPPSQNVSSDVQKPQLFVEDTETSSKNTRPNTNDDNEQRTHSAGAEDGEHVDHLRPSDIPLEKGLRASRVGSAGDDEDLDAEFNLRPDTETPVTGFGEGLDGSRIQSPGSALVDIDAQVERALSTPIPLSPPFSELLTINLGNNLIEEEKQLIACAAWPCLRSLIIDGNPLVKKRSGDPPLLKAFLTDQLGVEIFRKSPTPPEQIKVPNVNISSSNVLDRKVTLKMPRVPRCDPDRLLELEWIRQDRMKSLPPITPSELGEDELNSDEEVDVDVDEEEKEKEEKNVDDKQPFFMTQVDVEDLRVSAELEESLASSRLSQRSNNQTKGKSPPLGRRNLLSCSPIENFEEPKGMANNVRALRSLLNGRLLYSDTNVVPTNVKTHDPLKRKQYPKPAPETLLAPIRRQREINNILESMRTRQTTFEASVADVLNDRRLAKEFRNVRGLLKNVQVKYDAARGAAPGELVEKVKKTDNKTD